MFSRLTDCKFGKLSQVRGIESQNDVFSRYAHCEKFGGEVMFCSVVKDPDFAVSNIDVHNAVMDTALMMPTHVDDLVAIAFDIKNQFYFDVAVGRFGLGMLGQEGLDELTVVLGIH